MKRRNESIPKAHAHSNLQHKYKSLTEAQHDGDFKPLGTLAALLDICDLSDILALESPVALGDTFECVLKGVILADSVLMCIALKTSVNLSVITGARKDLPLLHASLQHRGCAHTATRHVSVDCCHLFVTIKAQTHVTNTC